MNTVQVAGAMMIAGAIVFAVGAGIGVPRVWSLRDPNDRLRLLEERRRIWRATQPLYGLGAVIAAAGVGVLAGALSSGRALLVGACASLLVGALTFSWSLYLRAARIRDFALGRLPGWPYTSYVWLTTGGLALLGTGLLAGDFPAWLGWLTVGSAVVFLAWYLRTRDIVPAVFYLLFAVVGIVLI